MSIARAPIGSATAQASAKNALAREIERQLHMMAPPSCRAPSLPPVSAVFATIARSFGVTPIRFPNGLGVRSLHCGARPQSGRAARRQPSEAWAPAKEGPMRRSLTRFDVTCLGLNAIVGSGVFALPDDMF